MRIPKWLIEETKGLIRLQYFLRNEVNLKEDLSLAELRKIRKSLQSE